MMRYRRHQESPRKKGMEYEKLLDEVQSVTTYSDSWTATGDFITKLQAQMEKAKRQGILSIEEFDLLYDAIELGRRAVLSKVESQEYQEKLAEYEEAIDDHRRVVQVIEKAIPEVLSLLEAGNVSRASMVLQKADRGSMRRL